MLSDQDIMELIDACEFDTLAVQFNASCYQEKVFMFPTEEHFPMGCIGVWSKGAYVVLRLQNRIVAGIVISRLEVCNGQ